ncbi:MAG: PAS domain-containing protein [Pseudomonadota bacterium]
MPNRPDFDPAALRTPQVGHAYDYWAGKRAGRVMPARADIDPAEMAEWLPCTMLVDVAWDPLDFRFRLVGTEIVDNYGSDWTGRRLKDLDCGGKLAEIVGEYAASVTDKTPSYFTDSYVARSGTFMRYERLLLPLSADGIDVNMLLGVQIPLRLEPHAGLKIA